MKKNITKNKDSDTLTLALNGDVTLQDFSKAMNHFKEIVSGLKEDIAPDSDIDWYIDKLEAGSATAVIRGVPITDNDIPSIKNIGTAFADIGRRIVHGETLTFNTTVINAVTSLRKMINGRISSINFQAAGKRYTVKKHAIFSPQKTYWATETFGCA